MRVQVSLSLGDGQLEKDDGSLPLSVLIARRLWAETKREICNPKGIMSVEEAVDARRIGEHLGVRGAQVASTECGGVDATEPGISRFGKLNRLNKFCVRIFKNKLNN